MSTSVRIRKITTIPPLAVFIQWTLENPEEFGDYQFYVERSESPAGLYEHIQTYPLVNAFHYVDKDIEDYRKRYQVYYRIHCIPPSGEENSFWSKAKPLEITPKHRNRGTVTFGIRRTIQDEFWRVLRHLNGSECAILKRKHMGNRCSICYDQVTKLPLFSHCNECKGTGWIDGYHKPYYTWVRVGASHISTQIASDGRTELDQIPFKMLDVPILDEDDIIVQLNRTRFMRVNQIQQPTLITQFLFQSGNLLEIAKGDVEYTLTNLLGGNEETCSR